MRASGRGYVASEREPRAAAGPAVPELQSAARPVSVGILRGVPIDPAVVLEYATRTFCALIVIVVTLLLARVVRHPTMRALTRGLAHANATISLGTLLQVTIHSI